VVAISCCPSGCARCRARSKAAHSGNCVRPPRDGRCGWSPCRTSSSLSPEFSHWRGSGPMNLRRLMSDIGRPLARAHPSPAEAWRADYNHERPHSRLGWMSPTIYAAARPHRHRAASDSNRNWIKVGGNVSHAGPRLWKHGLARRDQIIRNDAPIASPNTPPRRT
jgi:hypothetical protein